MHAVSSIDLITCLLIVFFPKNAVSSTSRCGSRPAVPGQHNTYRQMMQSEVKCFVVGDSGVGKTSLLLSSCGMDMFSSEYQHSPNVFDNWQAANMVVDGMPYSIEFYDIMQGMYQ